MIKLSRLTLIFITCFVLFSNFEKSNAQNLSLPQKSGIERALKDAGSNRDELIKAIKQAPMDQQKGMVFLIEHMPLKDLQSLSADYLLENVNYAYKARKTFSWASKVPEEIFLNDVLPYASIDERRDNWRKDFFEKFGEVVKDCQTGAEAAQLLNRDMFKLIGVEYHARKRPKPNQSPYESIEAGYASCSGLSVLLIDACRAVGVPARFVGIPRWANKRGNHSWVEIWDQKWHFTGACEYNKSGLNKTWFINDASHAIKGHPWHAIYASSWKSSNKSFPMIWDLSDSTVDAVDVTEHYAKTDSAKTQEDVTYLSLKSKKSGERLTRQLEVYSGDKLIAKGTTSGVSRDLNDVLTLPLKRGKNYKAKIFLPGDKWLIKEFTVPEKGIPWITLFEE